MPRAFLTGITGQDGGYLAEQLTAAGWQVHGLVHAHDPNIDELMGRCPDVLLHHGDLGDPAGLAALVDVIDPDEIYNLGGISSVAQSWEQPVLTATVTGVGAVALLEAAWDLRQRRGRAVKVLQASSAEMFGSPSQSPQTEQTPLNPTNPYGAAKTFAHHLVAAYRARGLFACSTILFNHESPRRPPTFVTRKITQAAARIARGEQDTLTLGNLDARRDWGWAPDYTRAMTLALRHPTPDDYIVATGQSHTVRDFAQTAFQHAGITDWATHITTDPTLTRPTDAPELVGDATHAHTQLGWRPTTTFDELIAHMVNTDL